MSLYSQAVLADAPVGYWRLGETSGATAADATGNGHDGTYNGTPTRGVSALVRDSDASVTFNALGDFVLIPGADAIRIPQGEFTIEAWAKPATWGDWDPIVVSSDFYDWWLTWYVNSGARSIHFGYAAGPSEGHVIWDASELAADGVFHVAGVRSGSPGHWLVSLYVNGVLRGTTTSATDPTSAGSDASTYIGDDQDGSFPDGTVDEVAFYDHALSAARVAAHYMTGRGGLAKFNASDVVPTRMR